MTTTMLAMLGDDMPLTVLIICVSGKSKRVQARLLEIQQHKFTRHILVTT